nr:alpha/beta fold hydrolase [Micromonospora tarapacensis]
MVCFPHAGGAASFYHPLARATAGVADVVGIQLPGRQDRRHEPCIDDLPALADAVADALGGCIHRPLAFFGHSMGAVLAFEVAARLERDTGTILRRLFVSGRRAPSRYRDDDLHRSGDQALIAELRALSGTDSALLDDGELLQMILPAIRGDYRAIERYRYTPGVVVSCPISALVGEEDPRATVGEVSDWAGHTTATFDLHTFPGRHFYLADEINGVATLVRGRLGQ